MILMAYKDCGNLMRKGKLYSSVEPLSKYLANSENDLSRIKFSIQNDQEISPIDPASRFIIAELIKQ